MPELPEVETCRRQLQPLLEGRRVEEVWLAKPSYVFLTPPEAIRKALIGRRIDRLSRHGKYLLWHVGPKEALLVHLGMTGQLFAKAYQPDNHVHMILTTEDSQYPIYFRDARKFGKLKWLTSADPKADDRLATLGPDALSADGSRLFASSRRRSTAVKNLLLDQSVLAGIGNIYADEALFRSGIRPRRAAKRLSLGQCDQLATNIREVLTQAIAAGGSSINDYVQADGSQGYFQIEHRVYGREGQACRVCGSTIKRVVIGQRSAHYCPRCQS